MNPAQIEQEVQRQIALALGSSIIENIVLKTRLDAAQAAAREAAVSDTPAPAPAGPRPKPAAPAAAS